MENLPTCEEFGEKVTGNTWSGEKLANGKVHPKKVAYFIGKSTFIGTWMWKLPLWKKLEPGPIGSSPTENDWNLDLFCPTENEGNLLEVPLLKIIGTNWNFDLGSCI